MQQQQPQQQPPPPTSAQLPTGEQILERLLISGVPVLKVQKEHQIVYKLAGPNQHLTPEQRENVTKELKRRYAMEMQQHLLHMNRVGVKQPPTQQQPASSLSSSSMPAHHVPSRPSVSATAASMPRTSVPPSFHRAPPRPSSFGPSQQQTSSSKPPAPSGPKRLPEEIAHITEIKKRFARSLLRDHECVQKPNIREPFKSYEDVMARLLPYHVFDYPDEDLQVDEAKLEKDVERNRKYFYSRTQQLNERFARLLQAPRRQRFPELSVLCEKILLEDMKRLRALSMDPTRAMLMDDDSQQRRSTAPSSTAASSEASEAEEESEQEEEEDEEDSEQEDDSEEDDDSEEEPNQEEDEDDDDDQT